MDRVYNYALKSKPNYKIHAFGLADMQYYKLKFGDDGPKSSICGGGG